MECACRNYQQHKYVPITIYSEKKHFSIAMNQGATQIDT